MTSACNPSQEHECSSVVGLCMSNSLNDPFLNISMNKTIFQNVCKISPASIQRAKRMEFIKMSNTQQNHPNNCLLNKNIQISFLEDNVNKLKSTHSLPEENRVQYDKMYTRPISSSYSPSTDTELVTTPNSDHVFPTKKDNNELYKLFPMYIRNDIPNSSSCSSFNSLGIISSPPSINTSDTHLNDKDKFSQLSNVELYHRKLSIIESKVTKSSQSLHLLLPRTTFAFYNNSVQKPSIINNNEQSLYHRINDKKSIINKSRIKSLGDIFKIPRLSFSNEVYPKKSCTYQNINKMIVDNNKIDNNDHGLRSQFELPLGTKDNHDHDSNHKVYTNYLTVPCETTMMLRKKSQIFNQYIRYSTEYVSTTETIKENEQQRKQRAVSVDICQTNKLFHLFDHKNDLNRKSKDYKQLLYDSQSIHFHHHEKHVRNFIYYKNQGILSLMIVTSPMLVRIHIAYHKTIKQQQQNQGNIESLHTSSSTLCSFIPATPNWTNAAIIGEHLWNETTSNETCYIDESECTKSGAKRKCSVCHIVCHVNCLPLVQVSCRPTFREAFIHDYRTEKTFIEIIVIRNKILISYGTE
ncbi:hypothetical protein Smp_131210 [Schistosoma mansoni]|uniref:hypothetical protein n=1 Tax=Schistosoma mansoni TaxID=6183 RepID=UPI00022DC3A1|nr:hypothetical protein Smp_131210 [Schistosoma mansoni]|eukprot:XP_018653360.1 hypothetical protein Smp_131210 [Schistosoma mansoni]